MSTPALAERLEALSSSFEHRSKAAVIRELAPSIARAQAAGVPRQVIVDELNRAGLKISLTTLDENMRRIRKRARHAPGTAVAVPVADPSQLSRQAVPPATSSVLATSLPSFPASPLASPPLPEPSNEPPPPNPHDPSVINNILKRPASYFAELESQGRKRKK